MATPAFANTTGSSAIMNAITSASSGWYQSLLTVSEGIFYVLFGVDFVYLVAQWLIGGKDVHEIFTSFIRKLMTIGVFYTILLNGGQLIRWVTGGFQAAGSDASGGASTSIQSILGTAASMFTTCLNGPKSSGGSGHSPGLLNEAMHLGSAVMTFVVGDLVGLITAIIVLLAMVYLVLEYLSVKIEAIFVGSAGIIMMGFSGSRWTVQHAEGYLKYAVSVGVRLMVLTLWIGFIENQASTLSQTILTQVSSGSNLFLAYADVIVFALLIAWLTKKLPSIANSVLSGGSTLSGGADGAKMAAVAATVAAAATGGVALGAGGAVGSLGAAGGGGAAGAGGSAATAAGNLSAAGGQPPVGGGIAGNLSNAGGAVETVPAPSFSGDTAQGAAEGVKDGAGASGGTGNGGPVAAIPAPARVANAAKDSTQSGGTQARTATDAMRSDARQGAGQTGNTVAATEGAALATEAASKTGTGMTGTATSGSDAAGSADSISGTDAGTATDAANGSSGDASSTETGGGSDAAVSAPASTSGTSQSAGGAGSGQPNTQGGKPDAPKADTQTASEVDHRATTPNTPTQPVSGGPADVQAPQQKNKLDFYQRLERAQKVHQIGEQMLSPGGADTKGVAAPGGMGLKHSE
jgi:type IV secretion system protein TrbL